VHAIKLWPLVVVHARCACACTEHRGNQREAFRGRLEDSMNTYMPL